MFAQLINRLFTGSQPEFSLTFTADDRASIRQLHADLALLKREQDDHAEKTRRSLERYRARLQPRKDGKFGPEDAPDADNGSGLTQGYGGVTAANHREIEAMARERGLLK